MMEEQETRDGRKLFGKEELDLRQARYECTDVRRWHGRVEGGRTRHSRQAEHERKLKRDLSM